MNNVEATDLTLNDSVSAHLDSDSYTWYSFTASENDSYLINIITEDSPITLLQSTVESGESINYIDDYYESSVDLAENEIVWIRIDSSEDADYTITVTKGEDNIIPEEVCAECNGVNGEHQETCSHYGENVEDSDEDDNLIYDVTAWSDYNDGGYHNDDPTSTYEADQISFELPVGFTGNFGARYDGLNLAPGTYQLSFDFVADGMVDADIRIRYEDGDDVFLPGAYSSYEPWTNILTFTIEETIENGSLTILLYTDSVNEGSLPASNVSISNISLVLIGDLD